MSIDRFKGEYAWLSNFFIEPDGTNVEAEFQAAKHTGHPWRQATIRRATPARAKKLGRRWSLSKYQVMEWNNRKTLVMKHLIRQKVKDHPEIGLALMFTGDEKIVEGNNWHDNFWGDCRCLRCYKVGYNRLGQVWMEVRDELAA